MATLTPPQIRNLAASVLPGATAEQLDMAVAIAMAESRGQTDAISPTGDYGVWQINLKSWPMYSAQYLLTPTGNAKAMAHISKGGTNWGPWVTFGTSKYRDFLPGGAQAAAAASGMSGALGITIPGTGWDIDLTPGFDVPNPLDVATDWVEPLVSRASIAVLALVLTSAGLSLFALGLFRLTSSTTTTKQALGAATAATGGIGAVAALA